jgi:hypothetical protein
MPRTATSTPASRRNSPDISAAVRRSPIVRTCTTALDEGTPWRRAERMCPDGGYADRREIGGAVCSF